MRVSGNWDCLVSCRVFLGAGAWAPRRPRWVRNEHPRRLGVKSGANRFEIDRQLTADGLLVAYD